MSGTELKTDLYKMQETIGTPFDDVSVTINPLLAFALKEGYLSKYEKVKDTIDPLKIVWIANHYTERNSNHLRTWLEILHNKERTSKNCYNITSKLKNNPYYYFNGDMCLDEHGRNDDVPEFYFYRNKYYMMAGKGNHRTVIGKYLWYFNKDILQKQGYYGIKAYSRNVKEIPYKMIAIHKLLLKYINAHINVVYDNDKNVILEVYERLDEVMGYQNLLLKVTTKNVNDIHNYVHKRSFFKNMALYERLWTFFNKYTYEHLKSNTNTLMALYSRIISINRSKGWGHLQ